VNVHNKQFLFSVWLNTVFNIFDILTFLTIGQIDHQVSTPTRTTYPPHFSFQKIRTRKKYESAKNQFAQNEGEHYNKPIKDSNKKKYTPQSLHLNTC
jgi:hypothetical protein